MLEFQYHLIRKHEDGFYTEPSVTQIKQGLNCLSEELHNKNVIVSLLATPDKARNPDYSNNFQEISYYRLLEDYA